MLITCLQLTTKPINTLITCLLHAFNTTLITYYKCCYNTSFNWAVDLSHIVSVKAPPTVRVLCVVMRKDNNPGSACVAVGADREGLGFVWTQVLTQVCPPEHLYTQNICISKG